MNNQIKRKKEIRAGIFKEGLYNCTQQCQCLSLIFKEGLLVHTDCLLVSYLPIREVILTLFLQNSLNLPYKKCYFLHNIKILEACFRI